MYMLEKQRRECETTIKRNHIPKMQLNPYMYMYVYVYMYMYMHAV